MSDKNEDFQPSSQQESDSQPGSSQNACQTLWQNNDDVDVFEPIHIKEEALPIIIAKVESISDPTNAGSTITRDKAMRDVCKLLALNGNQSLKKIKEEFKQKYSVSNHDPEIDSEKATTCTSIYIAGMPVWFHFLHMEALIQLNSEFDVDCGSYYIDIVKDTENKQSDKCLIRFTKSRDCLQVYKGLHGIVLIDNDKKMLVNLDLGNGIANLRDNYNPKFEEQLRTFNETRTRFMPNSEQVIDGASDISDDPIELDNIDLNDTESTTEISILVEDDDIIMVDDILNETQEPAESERQNRAPAEPERQNKAPAESERQNKAPAESERQNKAPAKSERQNKAPAESERQNKAPAKSERQNKAPAESKRQNKAPAKSERQNKAPAESKRQNKAPAESERRNKAPAESERQNKAPAESERQNKQPAESERQNKQPAESERSLDDNECKIVHIKNLDRTKVNYYYRAITQLMNKWVGTMPKLQHLRCVVNEIDQKSYSGEVLLEFHSHTDAVTVMEKLNGVSCNIAAEGGTIKAVMGVGYSQGTYNIMTKSIITDMDLRVLTLKRKLQCFATNSEDQNPAKKTRSDKSPTPRSAASEYACSIGGVKINVDELNNIAYGLTTEFMLKHGLKLPFSREVIVTGLNDDINEAKLMEVFSLAGEVKKIERAKNYAKIEYDHPLEAVQAISMLDGQELYNQRLIVQMGVLPRSTRLPEGLSGIGQGLGKNGEPLRGVRIEAEMRRIYDFFVDLGKMERLNAPKYSPFIFTFKEIPAGVPVPSEKDSNSSKPFDNSSKSSKGDSEDSAALEAWGTALVAQGLIPPQTNCKSLKSILTALQKKTPDPNISAAVPNPGILEAWYKTINNMMQFMPPNPVNIIPVQPNTAQNVRNVASNTGDLTATNLNQTVPIQQICGPAVGNPTPQPLSPSLLPTSTWPLDPFILHNVPPPPFFNQLTPQPLNQNRPMYEPTLTWREVPTQPILPQQIPSIQVQPIQPQSQNNEEINTDIIHNVPPPPFFNQLTPQLLNQNRPMYEPTRTWREVPTQPILPQQISPIKVQPIQPQSQNNEEIKSDILHTIPPPPLFNQLTPQPLNQNRSMNDPTRTRREVPIQPILPQQISPIQVQPIQSQSQNNAEKTSEILVFKNLPACVTTATLASKMREVGEVKFCEITGGGRGIVCYKHADDADSCIRLYHRSEVDGQVIDVGFL